MVYLVNQLICQNHEEDFFQILSASPTSQNVRTLTIFIMYISCPKNSNHDQNSAKYNLEDFSGHLFFCLELRSYKVV